MIISAATSAAKALAVEIRFADDTFIVRLSDGRELAVPLEWFPRLRDAAPDQQNNWRLIGGGVGIHWEDLDEDLAVAGLLNP